MITGFEVRHLAVQAPTDIDALRAQLTWSQPSVHLFGKHIPIPRLTSWMGDAPYTYSGVTNHPLPMPKWVADVAAQVSQIVGRSFNSVLANLYRDGKDSVSWHADDEPELGDEPVIASVSLGAARTFAVKHRVLPTKAWKVQLCHGDLVIMSGRSQADFLHSVPKTTRPVGQRINLTFRNVRQ